jgi:hypothetical protein
MPRRKGTCVYCGSFGPLHMDHVPPENLFEPHEGSNLITVPCCRSCNGAASKDDQYFLVFIGLREGAKLKPEHDRLWQKVRRTLKRKEASKFRQNVTSKIRFVSPVTATGIILPPALSVPINGLRVAETVNRFVKGLYCHETRRRLPDTHLVISHDELALQNPPIERTKEISQFRNLITQLQTTPRKTVCTVFAYHWASNPAQSANTIWLLDFFGGIRFFCITQPSGSNLLGPPTVI